VTSSLSSGEPTFWFTIVNAPKQPISVEAPGYVFILQIRDYNIHDTRPHTKYKTSKDMHY